jgi:hypothetical protein
MRPISEKTAEFCRAFFGFESDRARLNYCRKSGQTETTSAAHVELAKTMRKEDFFLLIHQMFGEK